jgi:hypothetical protein
VTSAESPTTSATTAPKIEYVTTMLGRSGFDDGAESLPPHDIANIASTEDSATTLPVRILTEMLLTT